MNQYLAAFFLTIVLLPLIMLIVVMYAADYISTETFLLMFTLLLMLSAFIVPRPASASTYTYKNKLVVKAPTYRAAAKACYLQLTHGVYPGDEKGLDIIDICANPVKEVK